MAAASGLEAADKADGCCAGWEAHGPEWSLCLQGKVNNWNGISFKGEIAAGRDSKEQKSLGLGST